MTSPNSHGTSRIQKIVQSTFLSSFERAVQVQIKPATRAAPLAASTPHSFRSGYIAIRSGKARNAKRNLSLTARAAAMLKAWKAETKSALVFPGDSPEAAILGTSIDHQHDNVRTDLKPPADFVIHSLRHTMLTRLGEAGADAFTIMKIAGHSSVTVSQRYVHPTPEGMERAFERLESLNATKFEQANAEAKAEAAGGFGLPLLPAKVPAVKNNAPVNLLRYLKKKKGPLAQRLVQRTHNPLVVGSNPTGPTTSFFVRSRDIAPTGRAVSFFILRPWQSLPSMAALIRALLGRKV